MPTCLSNFFKKTPDQELVENLQKAVDEYNKAFRACKSNGLSPA